MNVKENDFASLFIVVLANAIAAERDKKTEKLFHSILDVVGVFRACIYLSSTHKMSHYIV